MKYFNITSFLFLFVVTGVSSAYACTCSPPSQRSAYRDAKAVFIGQVIEVNEKTPIPPKLKDAVFYGVKFRVEKAWKGARGREITLLSDMGLLSCAHWANKFRVGEKYLVYAYDKELFDFGCSRSVHLQYASDDIKRLNSIWFRFFARIYPFPKL
jgi:hypothetical protein